MVVSVHPLQESKRKDKIPAASIIKHTGETENFKIPVSPKGSPLSLEDEVAALKTRNKVLTDALKAIKHTAEEEEKKHYDLVWFARNRCRFPLHEDRKRIERQHSNEIEKLHTNDGDYHHGIHSGILAASRMFKKHADIVEHIEDEEDVPSADEIITIASEHKEKVEETKKNYPEVHVDAPPSAK